MKKGSALLIVLGMVAFLVISAIAFSAYMRYSRLPSSYLRRTSSSRLLAKAALAEAIDHLDIALGNDPYPFSSGYEFTAGGDYTGNGYDLPRATTENQTARRERRNYWRNHCFIGTNRLVDAEETVSTLTLEGLAYLPPALINEARFYSRHSDGARWHSFSFDAGRYAFFAVDVSDHIDVNRVFADRPRTSADDGKVTLAYAFENAAHTGEGSPGPGDWDDFISQFNEAADVLPGEAKPSASSSKLPLVSLADLNLAANKEGWRETLSPFCRYLEGGNFVKDLGTDGSKLSTLAFVTDSCFPNTNTTLSAKYDLCSAQPFNNMRHQKSQQMSYADQFGGAASTPILTMLSGKVTDIDTVSLYDYLDENDIPTSLALPSVERVPMIAGLEPNVTFQLQAAKAIANPPPTSGLNESSPPLTGATAVKHTYTLKIQGADAKVKALCLFPFRHNDKSDDARSYKVDFAIRIGFTLAGGPGLRTILDSGFAIADESEFKKDGVIENGVIKLYRQASKAPTSKNVKEENDAFSTVGDGDAFSGFSQIENYLNNNPVFTVPHRYEVVNLGTEDHPNWQYEDKGPDTVAQPTIDSKFYPLNANGTGNGGFDLTFLRAWPASAGIELLPYMTVTARVKSDWSGKTVDLVPAFYADDQGFNGLSTDQEVEQISGSRRPLLVMAGDQKLVYGTQEFDAGQAVTVNLTPTTSGGSFVCPDPRWNFAPENFYVRSSLLPDANTFIQNCNFENDGRDCDLFMAVSDQGYMQSPSEFAFLPRTTNQRLGYGSIGQFGDAAKNPNGASFATSEGVAPYGDLAHGHLMWKTYRLFPEAEADNLYGLGLTVGGSGFRLNPYTCSKNVMAAALANTPYSWWAASTNYSSDAAGKSSLKDLSAKDFNSKYAFSGMNSDAKLGWKDLENIAANMISAMRKTDGNWQAGFHSLAWDDEPDKICGVQLSNSNVDLYDTDREMLYGFWRDSFAAKQQLFLVFVRAEPTMMGGGAVGATPPSLGARAVALVWRDPQATRADVGSSQPRPHRTRVLFYRQFE